MTWWKRLAQNRLLDVGAALLVLICLVRIAVILPERAITYDFSHYYVASRLMLEGGNPYRTDLAPLCVQRGFITFQQKETAPNPPPFQWLFAPLAMLPARIAFWLWVGVEALSLCVILWLTRRLLGERLSARGWWFVCAGAVSSATVYWHFYYSQVGLLLAALVLAAYSLHRDGKHTAACLMASAAGLLKAFPFVLLPWFVWRSGNDTRTRSRHALLAFGWIILLILATGTSQWMDFLRYATQVGGETVNYSFNFNLPSFMANLGYAAYGFVPPASVAQWWSAAETIIALGVIALGYSVCLRGTGDGEAEFCLLCIAMLAGSVRTWGHYFVFLIFPVAAAATRVAARSSAGRVTWLALILVLLNVMGTWSGSFLDRHLYLKILCNYMPLYGLVALGVFWVKQLLVGTNEHEQGEQI